MKRTIAYIDGYNLYYGLLKRTPYKWLDPVRLVSALLRDDHELFSVKYFTSPVKTYPHDTAALDRQKVYLQALSTLHNLEIIVPYQINKQFGNNLNRILESTAPPCSEDNNLIVLLCSNIKDSLDS